MPNRHSQLDLLAALLMVVLCLCWGLNQVSIKVANSGFSPIFQAGLRGAGSGALVWAWSAWRGVPLFNRDGSFWVGALLGVLFAGEFILINWGLVFTAASRAVVFIYLAPFIVALGAHLFIPGERLGMSQVVGLICAFAGMALAFGDALRLPTHRELVGDIMMVGGACLWGATTVIIKATRLARISPNKVLFYQLAASAVLLLPLSRAIGEPGITAPSGWALLTLGYQILGIAFVSYLTWFWLIAHYPASRLSAFSFLTPLFGVLAGGILLGEPITRILVAALALVGLGIYLVNRHSRAVAAVAAKPQTS